MAGEKKRRGRRAYLDDFQPTASGGYVYTGKTHPFPQGRYTWRQAMARLWLLAGVMAGAALLGGCLPAAGTLNTPYVILPYAGSLVSAGSVVWLMGRLSHGDTPLPDYVYAATVGRFGRRGMLVLICAAATLVGEGIYLAGHGPGDLLPGTLAFLACEGLVLAAAAIWRRFAQNLHW